MLLPLTLTANQPPARFYRGGEKIAAFRDSTGVAEVPAARLHTPEDWVASTTCLAGDPRLGLTVLPDGRTLTDAIQSDPLGWLGPDHVAAFGSDPKLLVKLLDAGQRLPVHIHPNAAFAHQHLGRSHGKAEAWYILQGGVIHLGLKEDLSRSTLERLVTTQAVDELLPLLHEIEVAPGDTVFVPAGTLHAIGEGVFLVELQEPEDLSILLEWRDFDLDGENDGHLGLGFDIALDAVDLRGSSLAAISSFLTRGYVGNSLFVHSADEFFHLGRTIVDGMAELNPGFAVVVAIDGQAALQSAHGHTSSLSAGTTIVVPHGAGPLRLTGQADILIARPPATAHYPTTFSKE
ncbi:class I mannose-6-phosphate isomerase [Salinibacterium sp. PAMC 21357]|uniref:class I mannose-6-phosphate isomerase n=1 Tax=Salinibacterium sp. PAMC 21357 TaxID=1112215 RepID=UPI0002886ED3|nr:class I mannose-6-phosphate isomerase [Salinibacterium sp. PAMC 21357]